MHRIRLGTCCIFPISGTAIGNDGIPSTYTTVLYCVGLPSRFLVRVSSRNRPLKMIAWIIITSPPGGQITNACLYNDIDHLSISIFDRSLGYNASTSCGVIILHVHLRNNFPPTGGGLHYTTKYFVYPGGL